MLLTHEAAILRVGLRVLESRTLRSISGKLNLSVITVNRHEKAVMATICVQLASLVAGPQSTTSWVTD
jgi:hypothetical protein